MSCDTIVFALPGSPPSRTGGTVKNAPGGFCVRVSSSLLTAHNLTNKMMPSLAHLMHGVY